MPSRLAPGKDTKSILGSSLLPSVCPYCAGKVLYMENSEFLYGKDYGPVYVCEHHPKLPPAAELPGSAIGLPSSLKLSVSCDAYVGTYKGSRTPLGTLADARVRKLRHLAHEKFAIFERINEMAGIQKPRSAVYAYLAHKMNIDKSVMHFGFMKEKDLSEAIHYINEALKDLEYEESSADKVD